MKKQKGFTLIELLVYISLVSIFLVGAIRFSWDVIYSREKAFGQRIVEQNTSTTMARIAYEIRQAKDISSLTSTQLVLDNDGSTTTISLSGTKIQISPNGTGPYDLTSNQIRVTDLTFTDLSSTDTNSKSVGVSLTIEQLGTGTSQQFIASNTITESIELNAEFNQARNLLVDFLSLTTTPNGREIEGIDLENTGDSDIIIDQVYIAWTNTVGGENVTNVQIELDPEEWSGSEASGSTLDIADYTIVAGSVAMVSHIIFDDKVWEGEFDLHFIMADGSIHKTYFTLPASTAGGASPTPSPTPSNTCPDYCTALPSYTAGACRANPSACTGLGETHESGGDTYCTGGPSADTCCCAP